jgi:hypothetical protein
MSKMSKMQCECLTIKGTRCLRPVSKDKASKYCHQHQNCKNPMGITGVPDEINVPDVSKLVESIKCRGDGRKTIPFLIRISKSVPDRICNVKSGINRTRILNSTIAINFKGNMNNIPKIWLPIDFKQKIEKCKEPLVIINLGLLNILGDNNHANILIIDIIRKEIEHFEPHGELSIVGKGFNRVFDKIIANMIPDLLPNSESYKFISSLDYCPKIGPQKKHKEFDSECTDGGYCAIWTTLYGHIRIVNPSIARQDIINYMLNNIDISYLKKYITLIDNVVSDDEVDKWDTVYEKFDN